jgi:hypothetical protein
MLACQHDCAAEAETGIVGLESMQNRVVAARHVIVTKWGLRESDGDVSGCKDIVAGDVWCWLSSRGSLNSAVAAVVSADSDMAHCALVFIHLMCQWFVESFALCSRVYLVVQAWPVVTSTIA